MKRVVYYVLLLLLLCGGKVFAESGDIECTSGNYEGWHVWYERQSMGPNEPARFHFENETGITAFNVYVIVNFFDYFDKHLHRLQYRTSGPIHKYAIFAGYIPEKASKITCEVYWSTSDIQR